MPSKKQNRNRNRRSRNAQRHSAKKQPTPPPAPKEPNYPPIPSLYEHYEDSPYNDLKLEKGVRFLCFNIWNSIGGIEKGIDVCHTTTIMITKELECECCVGFCPGCVNLIKDRLKLYTELIFEYSEFISDGDYKKCMDYFKKNMDTINIVEEENDYTVSKKTQEKLMSALGYAVYLYYNTMYGLGDLSFEEKKEIFPTYIIDFENIPWEDRDCITV